MEESSKKERAGGQTRRSSSSNLSTLLPPSSLATKQSMFCTNMLKSRSLPSPSRPPPLRAHQAPARSFSDSFSLPPHHHLFSPLDSPTRPGTRLTHSSAHPSRPMKQTHLFPHFPSTTESSSDSPSPPDPASPLPAMLFHLPPHLPTYPPILLYSSDHPLLG